MRVAYITDQGAVVFKKGRRLAVTRNRQLLTTLRVTQLDQVVLWGRIRLTPGALALLMDQGIDTVFISVRGRFRGRIVGPASKNILLRWAQYERVRDDAFVITTARAIVEAKVNNARALLRHRLRRRDQDVLREGIARLRQILREIPHIQDLDRLRGLEGEAAHTYFQTIGASLQSPFFRFTRRTRRPPRDPTNALLSLLYTLLLTAMMHAVHQVGLDPYLGVFHQMGYGKPALALDLIEEFRAPLVDALVLRLIERGTVRPEDFMAEETEDGKELSTRLTSDALKKVIGLWESRCQTTVIDPATGHAMEWRALMVEQARRMARAFRDRVDYEPFRWR